MHMSYTFTLLFKMQEHMLMIQIIRYTCVYFQGGCALKTYKTSLPTAACLSTLRYIFMGPRQQIRVFTFRTHDLALDYLKEQH